MRARTLVLRRQNTVAQFIATRTISGALQGGGETKGDKIPTAVVGAARNRLECGEGEGVSGSGTGGSKRGSVGDIGIGSGIGPTPHARVDRGRHQGGGAPGSQWFQWGGVERGGGLS